MGRPFLTSAAVLLIALGAGAGLFAQQTGSVLNSALGRPSTPAQTSSALPNATPTPTLMPTPTPYLNPLLSTTGQETTGDDRSSSEIAVGDAFYEHYDFKAANAAYLRAMRSENKATRNAALLALRKSLAKQSELSSWIVFGPRYRDSIVLKALHKVEDSVGSGFGSVVGFATVGALVWSAWITAGKIGNRRGRQWVSVSTLQGAESEMTARFRLALRAIAEEQRQPLGNLSADPVSPYIEASLEDLFPGALLAVSESLGTKYFAIVASRLRRPRYRIQVAWEPRDKSGILIVALQLYDKIIQVWQQRIRNDDSFSDTFTLATLVLNRIKQIHES